MCIGEPTMRAAQIAKTAGVFAALIALTCGEALPQQSANYVVRGQVRAANHSPVAGYIVRLASKGRGRETLLGQAVIDPAGRYQISYPATQLSGLHAGSHQKRAAVIVRVFAPERASVALAQSEVIYNVRPAMMVNLTVVRAPAGKRFNHK
jgi:hypothetical protein